MITPLWSSNSINIIHWRGEVILTVWKYIKPKYGPKDFTYWPHMVLQIALTPNPCVSVIKVSTSSDERSHKLFKSYAYGHTTNAEYNYFYGHVTSWLWTQPQTGWILPFPSCNIGLGLMTIALQEFDNFRHLVCSYTSNSKYFIITRIFHSHWNLLSLYV